jgi:glycine oxidase
VEDAGFDTSVHSDDLRVLRLLAAQLLPQLASETAAPLIDAWAGLRPATPDGLPMLGATAHPGLFVATGHYRNGILQAPGTAILLADVLEGKAPAVDLSALSPLRFALTRAS